MPKEKRRGLVVGLTGGIATGKSTVARMFEELGAAVVSADVVARQVVEPGEPAWGEIKDTFGEEVLAADGTLDRRALGAVVFGDEEARRRLEAITHPRIRERMRRQIDELAGRGLVVIAEIPLLFESAPARALVDETVVVYVDEDVQEARLMERDGFSRAEARARMAAQKPLAEKAALADWVIDNGRGLEETKAQVERLWRRLHADQE